MAGALYTNDYLRAVQQALKPVFMQYNQMMTPEVLKLWATTMTMHGVPAEALGSAALFWLATEKFMPQPVELANLAKGESGDNRAMRACERMLEMVRRLGPYITPPVEDPILARTIEDFGGWRRLCETAEDTSFFRRDFIKAYQSNQRVTPVIGMSNQPPLAFGGEQPSLFLDVPAGPRP